MQRTLVDERRWIGQRRFLHALNYCTLLPGPEAQQLAAQAQLSSTASVPAGWSVRPKADRRTRPATSRGKQLARAGVVRQLVHSDGEVGLGLAIAC